MKTNYPFATVTDELISIVHRANKTQLKKIKLIIELMTFSDENPISVFRNATMNKLKSCF